MKCVLHHSMKISMPVPSLQSSKEERGERKGNEVHTSTHLLEKFKFSDAFLLCSI